MIKEEFLDTINSKGELFLELRKWLNELGLTIANEDAQRPWGGFFVLHEKDTALFIQHFFSGLALDPAQLELKLSPKILVVEPHKRLSWQFHHRRAEVWKLIGGDGKIARSEDDSISESISLMLGETIRLKQGERHRLIGGDQWAIVAEIWIHTDANHPSDEEDIIRLEDDFARK
jgi:mannose-6-phosphate isomerase